MSHVLLLAVLSGLRLFNPADAAAAARVSCDGQSVIRQVAPHAIEDVDGSGCVATSAAPLLLLETGADNGIEWQRAVAPADDACPATIPLMLPLSGCRFGTAVAAVTPIPGASYSWSIDGGTFLSGLGTDRVTISLDGGDTVKLSVAAATAHCTSTGSGVIALRDAFTIKSFAAGSGLQGQPRTITWEYTNGTPAAQILSGTDLAAPVTLPNDARSYSYTPLSEGDKAITLQARSGALPAAGRPHAAGRGTAAASDCNVARSTVSYHVDCNRPDAAISAPASTNADTPFTARVHLESYSTATWTIKNGTPSTATGQSVVIKATGSGPVDISVTVTSGNCSASASKRVTVDPNLSCDNPTATVFAILRNDCSTVVQARFDGKPPFKGSWNDGVPFITNNYTVDRVINAAGTFFVAGFQDALCAGAASNSVAAAPKNVGVVLTAPGGFCATGSPVVATFSGTPPFSGTWSDGVTFTTSANQITRQVTQGGSISLQFADATCGLQTSSTLQFYDPGTISVSLDPAVKTACLPAGSSVKLYADIVNGAPPYSITWSDGYVQTAPASSSTTAHLARTVFVQAPSATYGIVTAHDAVCNLKVGGAPITLAGTPSSAFSVSGTLCPGQTATAALVSTPALGSGIGWSVSNGTIVSGQGTATMKFTPNAGSCVVTVSVSSSLGCASSSTTSVTAFGTPAKPQPALTPASPVPVGTVVTAAWTTDKNTNFTTIDASSSGNQPSTPQCSGSLCWSTYTPKNAGGLVTLTVHAFGYCGEVINGSTTLTVQ